MLFCRVYSTKRVSDFKNVVSENIYASEIGNRMEGLAFTVCMTYQMNETIYQNSETLFCRL
jgi:hypothetical protein